MKKIENPQINKNYFNELLHTIKNTIAVMITFKKNYNNKITEYNSKNILLSFIKNLLHQKFCLTLFYLLLWL